MQQLLRLMQVIDSIISISSVSCTTVCHAAILLYTFRNRGHNQFSDSGTIDSNSWLVLPLSPTQRCFTTVKVIDVDKTLPFTVASAPYVGWYTGLLESRNCREGYGSVRYGRNPFRTSPFVFRPSSSKEICCRMHSSTRMWARNINKVMSDGM